MKYATFMQNHLELLTYISFYLNMQNMQNKKKLITTESTNYEKRRHIRILF